MGSDCHVIVVGDQRLLDHAIARIEQLEAKWSRFRPTSEISRMNAAAGTPVIVSPETLGLIERACDGRRMTHGLFDPTLLTSVIAAGYDRSFEQLMADRVGPVDDAPSRASGASIVVDAVAGCVRVPEGIGFDPGGIGKGFAADLVYEELLEIGATGTCVNIGGDLRVGGEPPNDDGWIVAVEHPLTGARVMHLELFGGACATSARTKRTWMTDGRPAHHLIDPRSGRPSLSSVAQVTVVADEGWRAEVWAKAAFLAGASRARSTLEEAGVSGVVIVGNGDVSETADLAEVAVS